MKMKTLEVVFDQQVGKKHSVCFKTSQVDPAVSSIYVSRKHLGKPIPERIRIIIEEEKG
jgi:hypothetical protein